MNFKKRSSATWFVFIYSAAMQLTKFTFKTIQADYFGTTKIFSFQYRIDQNWSSTCFWEKITCLWLIFIDLVITSGLSRTLLNCSTIVRRVWWWYFIIPLIIRSIFAKIHGALSKHATNSSVGRQESCQHCEMKNVIITKKILIL